MADRKHFSEQRLHEFWKNSRYFTRLLLTTTGHQIEIIQRGAYNRDAGPDFRSAVIKIDNKLYRGDVEIHVHARDWAVHGHQNDPAYNKVILHVALDTGAVPRQVCCENGREVLQVLVPPQELGESDGGKSLQNSNLILPFCPLAEHQLERKLRTVRAAGKLRLGQKTARMRELIHSISWDQLLYRSLCEALGYSKNQKPFLQLADTVPIDLIFNELHHRQKAEPEVLIGALLFGAAGLLKPAEAGESDAEITTFLAPRQALWNHMHHILQIQPLPEAAWQFFRLRPQNFPTRRIAALVELIQKFYGHGMVEMLVGVFSAPGSKVRATIRNLRQIFVVPASGYWLHYYDFRSKKEHQASRLAGALLGDTTVDAIIVNVILPLLQLYAKETANASLANRVAEVYSAFPSLQSNQITRKMQRQLFDDEVQTGKKTNGSEFQQGLIHLHKNFCTPLRCSACLAIINDDR